MIYHQAIVGNRAFIVCQTFSESPDDFRVFSRPINPKTGKPWQATKEIARFKGERAKGKAMREWLYTCAAARKAHG